MNNNDFSCWKKLPKVESIIEQLLSCYKNGQYEYSNKEKNFSFVTRNYFKEKYPNLAGKLYGVYVIRKKETAKILYIGMAGTFDNKSENYTKQNLPERLSNRGKNLSRNEWMRNLYDKHGILLIQHFLLPDFEENPTPKFIESLLLQSFLKEKARLPLENEKF